MTSQIPARAFSKRESNAPENASHEVVIFHPFNKLHEKFRFVRKYNFIYTQL